MNTVWKERLEDVESRQRELARGVASLNEVIRGLREEWERHSEVPEDAQEFARSRGHAEKMEEAKSTVERGEGFQPPRVVGEPVAVPPPLPPTPPPPGPAKPMVPLPSVPRESFELKLGRVWFVRLGVVLLLTGMVFLANYAYHEWVMSWGAFPRALMLFLGSGAMAALGFRIEGKRPAMARFGQVLGAGGLAGVFYTVYASHYVEPLRWIASGSLTGGLLLAWTGFMVWIADRRKSEFLAGFSLLLAYYTCVVTPASGFLLFANLLLTVASVFFLLKNRWRTISLGALPVTYGAFVFWQYIVAGTLGNPAGSLTALGYLGCYWLVFTVAAFLARRGEMRDGVKPAWVAMNNIALFALGGFALPRLHGDWFWGWSLGLGIAFLALAYLSRRLLTEAVAVSRVYLAEGLLLATLGVLAKFTGSSLVLVLVAESVALLIASRSHWTTWYRAAAYGVALLGVITGIGTLASGGSQALIAALGAGVLLLGEGFSLRTPDVRRGGTFGGYYFAFLVLALLGTAAYLHLSGDRCVVALAMVPVVAIATSRFHRYRELAIASLAMAVAGHLLYLVGWIEDGPRPLWCSASLLALTVAVAQFWQRQKRIPCDKEHGKFLEVYLAIVEVMLPALMLYPTATASDWMLYGVLIGFGFYLKGTLFGSGWSAVLGQGYLAFAVATMIVQLGTADPNWLTSFFPILALTAIGLHGRRIAQPGLPFWDSWPVRGFRTVATTWYPIAALGLLGVWTLKFTDDSTRAAAFAGIGVVLAAFGLWRESRFAMRGWAVFSCASLAAVAWIGIWNSHFGVGDVAALLLVLAGQHLARRERAQLNEWATGMIAALGLLLGWWIVTRTIRVEGSDLYVTIGWCVYGAAVLAGGFVNRQRLYRLAGLVLLAGTGARLMFVDLWAFGTLARILSFLALGLVLVIVGFVYNRFSETIRKFL